MELSDQEKVKYTNRTYPAGVEDGEYQDFDIHIFDTGVCELCDGGHEKFIGTSDPSEPCFCFKHYAEINDDSTFFKDTPVVIEEKKMNVNECYKAFREKFNAYVINAGIKGKCEKCKTVWVWHKGLGGLKGSFCPACKEPLKRTTSEVKGYNWKLY
jgi:hypothetical protein